MTRPMWACDACGRRFANRNRAAFTARNRWLDGHVVLARERQSPVSDRSPTRTPSCCAEYVAVCLPAFALDAAHRDD